MLGNPIRSHWSVTSLYQRAFKKRNARFLDDCEKAL